MNNNTGKLLGLDGNTAGEPLSISHPQPGELQTVIYPNSTMTELHQGVYTCHIPLASGLTDETNIGIYPSGFNSKQFCKSLNKQ